MSATDWSALSKALADFSIHLQPGEEPRSMGGGQTSAWCVATTEGRAFVKVGPTSYEPMFSAEADGLREIAKSQSVRVPAVIACGAQRDCALLVTEWLELASASARVERLLGEQLAAMHRYTSDDFGWFRNNTIGLTEQVNTRCDSWLTFYAEHRLHVQVRLALDNGYDPELGKLGDQLVARLPSFFDGQPEPSLLHGDLWGGNWASCGGAPVIYDPAVYYGDRETDIAMTQLFGGFGAAFYRAYHDAWPLMPGYQRRIELYQLYHVLNHLNLFGNAYLGRSMQMLRSLLQ